VQCARWLGGNLDQEFEQAQRFFEQEVQAAGYAAAYESSFTRLVRAEMQKTMMALITEACTGTDPQTALEVVKAEFQTCLLDTVRRNDGTAEAVRVQGLRAENQGWAIKAIDSILLAVRSVQQ
jgi:hypothetical protein